MCVGHEPRDRSCTPCFGKVSAKAQLQVKYTDVSGARCEQPPRSLRAERCQHRRGGQLTEPLSAPEASSLRIDRPSTYLSQSSDSITAERQSSATAASNQSVRSAPTMARLSAACNGRERARRDSMSHRDRRLGIRRASANSRVGVGDVRRRAREPLHLWRLGRSA